MLASAALLAWLAVPFLHVDGARAQQPNGDTLRIGLVIPDSAARTPAMRSAARGVRLGAEEAARSAQLFGRSVRLMEGADADRLVSDGRVQALLGGFGEEECRALAAAAERRRVVVLDLGCDADGLRGAGCRRL